MPYFIEGWIEVRRGLAVNADLPWVAVLDLGSLIDVGDGVSWRLFGLKKRPPVDSNLPPLFVDRGVPVDASAGVQAAVTAHEEYEAAYGESGCGGYTHALWSEFQQAEIAPSELATSDWGTVFDLAERLARDERFSPDGVRFVVWFNW